MAKRAREDTSRKALDLWQAPEGAGDALVCIATSFTFDAAFFETECIGRFLQMDNHPSETDAVGYLIEREEKLAAAKVCALVDRRHARDKESLRWDIIGVLVPRAIQHSKVALLVWANHVRVIIGSGNLTEPGYRKNLEIFGTIELPRTGGDRAGVLSTIGFLESVIESGVGEDGPHTPKRRARDALGIARRHVGKWLAVPNHTCDPVFGVPGTGVLDQAVSLWPSARPPRIATVVSPFFDRPPSDRPTVKAVVEQLAKRRPRDVEFFVRTEPIPDGRKRVYAPFGMIEAAREHCDVAVYAVTSEQDGEVRDLHAKMLWLENDEWSLLVAGSSNFTAAGLTAATGGSFEACLVYRVKESDPRYDRFMALLPDYDEAPLALDSPLLVWDPEPEECEGQGDEIPLPAGFREAIYEPGTQPHLKIDLQLPLPAKWTIRVPNGAQVIGSDSTGGELRHLIPWPSDSVPFVLEVSWTHASGESVASWPVNVSDPASLPPPEALKGLTFEELLQILGSTRPLPEAVVDVIRKRLRSPRNGLDELDPLRRRDSPTFLLRRAKRVATALDRLRHRLERPALSRDAFQWRLTGPIGPMSLAEAIIREATIPGESKFYLAELALTLKRVQPGLPAKGGVEVTDVEAMLASAVTELDHAVRTSTKPGEGPLDRYVTDAFSTAVAS